MSNLEIKIATNNSLHKLATKTKEYIDDKIEVVETTIINTIADEYLTEYLIESVANSKYATKEEASKEGYLKESDAEAKYQEKPLEGEEFLTKSEAASTYISKNDNLILDDLQNHINDKKNPHNITLQDLNGVSSDDALKNKGAQILTGDLTVTGNLIINGTTTTTNSETVTTQNTLLVINDGAVSIPTTPSGIAIKSGENAALGLTYDSSINNWVLGKGNFEENNNFKYNEGEKNIIPSINNYDDEGIIYWDSTSKSASVKDFESLKGEITKESNKFIIGKDVHSYAAPIDHSSTDPIYGMGSNSNYGHVKVQSGDMEFTTDTEGIAAGLGHTHGNYSLESHNHDTRYIKKIIVNDDNELNNSKTISNIKYINGGSEIQFETQDIQIRQNQVIDLESTLKDLQDQLTNESSARNTAISLAITETSNQLQSQLATQIALINDDNLKITQAIRITEPFGKYIPDEKTGNYLIQCNGWTLKQLLTDAFATESCGNIELPKYNFTIEGEEEKHIVCKGELGSTFDAPTAEFAIENTGKYNWGPEDTGVKFNVRLSINDREEYRENMESKDTVTITALTGGNFTETPQTYSFNAYYSYSSGSAPITNKGNEDESQAIKSFESTDKCSITFESYRSMFFGVIDQNIDSIQWHHIRKLQNYETIPGEYNVIANSGDKMLVWAIPEGYFDNLTIEYELFGTYRELPFIGPIGIEVPDASGNNYIPYNIYTFAPKDGKKFCGKFNTKISLNKN